MSIHMFIIVTIDIAVGIGIGIGIGIAVSVVIMVIIRRVTVVVGVDGSIVIIAAQYLQTYARVRTHFCVRSLNQNRYY